MNIPPSIIFHAHAILAPYSGDNITGTIVTYAFHDVCEYIELLTTGYFGLEYAIDVDLHYVESKGYLVITRYGDDRILWVIKRKKDKTNG